MPRRYFRKLAILAKIEATYGSDAAPTGAANAIQVSNVTVTPLEAERVSRDLMRPYFGDQGFLLAGQYARVEFEVEMAGAGTAGNVPGYGPLLRASGMAEIVTAGTKVEYKPVSAGQEAISVYANLDGVNHAMVGARGTFTLSNAPKQIARFRFTLTGLLGPIGDAALPAAVYTAFQKPVVVNKANTTFGLHGLSAPMESFSLDLGNQVEPRMLVGSESIEIVDRKVSGSAVIEAVPIATKDWFTIANTSATGALAITHGTAAGNIVEIAAAAAQVGQPTYGNTQGILNNTLPLTLTPVSGDDELTIRVR